MLIKRVDSYIDEYGDERLYSYNDYLDYENEERMYTGAVKAANKAAKRAFFMNIGGKTGTAADRFALDAVKGLPKGSLPKFEKDLVRKGRDSLRKITDKEAGYVSSRAPFSSRRRYDTLN